jgi:hypothetical protein
MKKRMIALVSLVMMFLMIAVPALATEAQPAAFDWAGLLSSILYAMLAAVLPILAKAGYDFIKAKAAATLAGISNEAIRQGISDAMDAVYTAVTVVNQTYVDALKDKNLFDESAQKAAFNQAMDIAKELLTQAAKDALNDLYGQVDGWLGNQIEAAVNEAK